MMQQGVRIKMVMPAFCLGAILVAGLPDVRLSAQSQPVPRQSLSSAVTADGPARAQKLYESVLGYLQGFHAKGEQTGKKAPSGPRKWSGPSKIVSEQEATLRRTMETDEELALTRIERHERDLAIPPLERALKTSSRLVSADDSTRLKNTLQATRATSQSIAVETSAPGEITNSIGMRLVAIRPGSFVMGSTSAEIRRVQGEWNVQEAMLQPESPAHNVQISRPFLMGKYDVTVGQFKKFVSETGYSTVAEKQGWAWVYNENNKHWVKRTGAAWNDPGGKISDDYPVTLVCHADAEAFCDWLSRKENRRYYLPTEAQWEYAARGGKEGERYPWGND